ncbi:unnamed protein product [Musa hybrid cultivar]
MAWCEGAEAPPLLLIASWILSFFLNHTDPSKEKEKYVCVSLSVSLSLSLSLSGSLARSIDLEMAWCEGADAPPRLLSPLLQFRRAIERQVVTTSLESTCLGYPCFASCFLS